MTTTNLPASLNNLLTGLVATQAAARVSAGGEQYLKLQKSGIWTYGAEDIDVQDGSKWAADPNSFTHGYVCWESDKDKPAAKLGEVMRPATDPAIDPMSLPNHGSPWAAQLGVSLLCLTGEDKGTTVTYTTTSKGGTRAISELMGALIESDQLR